MYLSKLDMDWTGRAAQRYLKNPNTLHGALCAAGHTARHEQHHLFRTVSEPGRNAVYVYSDEPLDESAIPAGLSLSAQRDLIEWIDTLAPGTLLAFDVVAAPTKKVASPSSRNSRRVLLRDQDERLEWVRKRCSRPGCKVLDVCENEHTKETVRKRGGQPFYVHGYRYSGMLQVDDPKDLKVLLEEGIGSEKAYGFGMLMVSRP